MESDEEIEAAPSGEDERNDATFQDPSAKKKKKHGETFTLTFTNGTWIEDLVDVFDCYQVSDIAFTQILGAIIRVGAGDPKEIVLSESTVKRVRAETRKNRNLDLVFSDFDEKLTVGFDTKKVKMGEHQGGETKEHVVVNVQGKSGEKVVGIVQTEDAKGKGAAFQLHKTFLTSY